MHRKLALFLLRRYLKNISPENFVQNINYFLDGIFKILNESIPDLVQHAIILLSEMVITFGDQLIPNLKNIFLTLLQNEKTALYTLDGLIELVQHNYPIPIDFLQPISNFLSNNSESLVASQSLTLIWALINKFREQADSNEQIFAYITSIQNIIIPILLTSFTKFDQNGISEASCIFSFFFIKTGNPQFADCLVYYMKSADDALLFDAINLMTEFHIIPFHQPLVVELFNYLSHREDSPYDFGISSLAQEILSEIVQLYKETATNLLFQLIQICVDPGHTMRVLSLIVGYLPKPLSFMGFLEEHLHDEFRGDSILCMYSIFISINPKPEFTESLAKLLVPMVNDIDEGVRDKVLFVLEEIFNDNFSRDAEWLRYMLCAFNESIQKDDISFQMRISKIICEFLEPIEKIECDGFIDFYNVVFNRYLTTDLTQGTLLFDTTLLEMLTTKMNMLNIENFRLIIYRMKDIVFNYPEEDSHLMTLQCLLLRSLIILSPDFIFTLKETLEIINQITSLLMKMNFLYDENFWKLIDLLNAKTNLFQSELGQSWVQIAIQHFNNDELTASSIGIVNTFEKMLEQFDQNVLDLFAMGAINILENNLNNLRELMPIIGFLRKIVQIKQEKGVLSQQLANIWVQISERLT